MCVCVHCTCPFGSYLFPLNLSQDDRLGLRKQCDQLVNNELAPEDLLRSDESEVDSTTDIDSPVKKPKLDKSKPKAKQTKVTCSWPGTWNGTWNGRQLCLCYLLAL